jgi:hypothetical protein
VSAALRAVWENRGDLADKKHHPADHGGSRRSDALLVRSVPDTDIEGRSGLSSVAREVLTKV